MDKSLDEHNQGLMANMAANKEGVNDFLYGNTRRGSSRGSSLSSASGVSNKFGYVVRKPISIFRQIRELKDEKEIHRLNKILQKLRQNLPNGFKIGAAVGAGDSFLDSVAQVLNEELQKGKIKCSIQFNVTFLRDHWNRHLKEYSETSWSQQVLGNRGKQIPDCISNYELTVEDINTDSIHTKETIDGEQRIEQKMIRENGDIKIKIIRITNEGMHTQTDKLSFIRDIVGNIIIYVLSYQDHFVPLLSNIEKDIEEDVPVAKEEIYGILTKLDENNYSPSKKIKKKKNEKDKLEIKQGKERERQKIDVAFYQILANCKELLIMKAEKCEDILCLLDPLVSDNQCQIHSLFILNIVNKCYDMNTCSYDVGKLREEDREILSYAVLLTLLKVTHYDTFGLGLRDVLSSDFGGLVSSKHKEKAFIAKIKREFNTYSLKYIKEVTTRKLNEIFIEGEATARQLTLLPCYDSFCALIYSIQKTECPVVISLVRIKMAKSENNGVTYTPIGKDVLFYEFKDNTFCNKKNPDECEKRRPTIIFFCYSLIDPDNISEDFKSYVGSDGKFPKEEFLKTCDFRHIVMITGAGHIQFNKEARLTKLKDQGNKDLYKKEVEEYILKLHRKMLDDGSNLEELSLEEEFNVTDIVENYSKYLKAAEKYGCKDASYVGVDKIRKNIVRRICRPVFLAIHHVCVSNYLLESQRLAKLKYGTKLNATEEVNYQEEHGSEVFRVSEICRAIAKLEDVIVELNRGIDMNSTIIKEKLSEGSKILEKQKSFEASEILSTLLNEKVINGAVYKENIFSVLKMLQEKRNSKISKLLEGKVYGAESVSDKFSETM